MSIQLEREILCCGASTWGKVIAWLQIIGSIFSILVSKAGLVDLLYLGEQGFNDQILSSPMLTPELRKLVEIGYHGLIATFIATIAISIIGLLMGIIFLQGIKQKHERCLKTWILYIIISWLLLCLTAFLASVPMGVVFVEGIFLTLLHIFMIWVAAAILLDIREECTHTMNLVTSNLNFVRLDEEGKH